MILNFVTFGYHKSVITYFYPVKTNLDFWVLLQKLDVAVMECFD